MPDTPDEDDSPILIAPLVAIFATIVVVIFAHLVPHIRETGSLPTWSSLATFLGQ
jgi:hypothetical protein